MTYIVYLPNGGTALAKTNNAQGDWAIANVRHRSYGQWEVTAIYDAKDAKTMRAPDSIVASAERIPRIMR